MLPPLASSQYCFYFVLLFVFDFQSIIPATVDDSIPLQEEEMSLDSIETLPLVTMEVPSTPVSYYIASYKLM